MSVGDLVNVHEFKSPGIIVAGFPGIMCYQVLCKGKVYWLATKDFEKVSYKANQTKVK